MKKVKIEIEAQFGSKFQESFAHDSLFASLKAWRDFMANSHKKNAVLVKINGDKIGYLEFFNWEKAKGKVEF